MDSNSFSRFEKTFQDGDIIFCEYEVGDNKFYFIKRGEVKLIRMIDGQERMVDVLNSGVFFGEMSIIESEPRSATAVASGTVVLLEFSKDNFETVVLQNPQLSLWLIQTFVNRIIAQQQRFQIYSYDEPMPRIVMCLLNLRVLIKTESSVKTYIVNATSDDIAKWVGVTEKESKSILQALSNENLIAIEHSKIVITNELGLQRKLAMYKKRAVHS